MHVYEPDQKKAALLIVLTIAKNSEGDTTRGYAIAFVALRPDGRLLKLSNRYSKAEEAEMVVRREMSDYVLK